MKRINASKGAPEKACMEAISSEGKNMMISNLDPTKTVLFYGANTHSMCSVQKRREYRRQIRCTLYDLLDMGITTILIENSTIFGYYALRELARQRQKHKFTLMMIHRKHHCHHWLRTSRRLLKIRIQRSIQSRLYCDAVFCPVHQSEWIELLSDHICLAITEKPPYYRNRKALTIEQYNKWGPPLNEEKILELIRWMLDDGEKTVTVCHTFHIPS